MDLISKTTRNEFREALVTDLFFERSRCFLKGRV